MFLIFFFTISRGLAVSRSPDIASAGICARAPFQPLTSSAARSGFLRVPSVCVSPADPSLISSSDDEGGMLSSKWPET